MCVRERERVPHLRVDHLREFGNLDQGMAMSEANVKEALEDHVNEAL